MAKYHLVRIGIMGQVGRFLALATGPTRRHCRVVVQAGRGMELGEVLSSLMDERAPGEACLGEESIGHGTLDGQIVREMTADDRLTEGRLECQRQEAFAACEHFLQTHSLPAILVDVEYPFDAQTLLFHFLGDISPELEARAQQIAQSLGATAHLSSLRPTRARSEGGCEDCRCPYREGNGGCGCAAWV